MTYVIASVQEPAKWAFRDPREVARRVLLHPTRADWWTKAPTDTGTVFRQRPSRYDRPKRFLVRVLEDH